MSNITINDLIAKIQKLEEEIEKLKEENKILKERIKETSTYVAREEIRHQSIVIKNEVRDELRKELATKEDILLAEERLENKIELLNQKIDFWIKILIILIIISPFIPEVLKSIGLILR
jgi:chromosome segregation ATPase